MPLKAISITVSYVAWNTSTNAGATGDAANHTLKVVKDGTSASATNSPSEVDSTNAPGVYKLLLTSTEMTADTVTVCGKSSTANVVIIPVTVTTEHGVLPTAAAGTNTGLPVVGTQIPNASAAATGGLPTVGTGAGQINPDGAGRLPVNVQQWLGSAPDALSSGKIPADLKLWLAAAPAALSTNGYVQGMLLRWLTDNAGGTPNALISGRVDSNPGAYAATPPDSAGVTQLKNALTPITSTVNDASATTTGFVTALSSATTDFYAGDLLIFTSGTLAGQSRHISAYNGSTKAVTLLTALTAAPGNGDAFTLVPFGKRLTDFLGALGSDNRVKVTADAHTAGETIAGITGVTFPATLPDGSHYTNARGDNLANLDATVSSRSAPGTAQTIDQTTTIPGSPAAGTIGEALKFADTRLDTAVSTRSAPSTAQTIDQTTALPGSPGAGTVGEALKRADTNLDATVSSRMATFTLPSNFSSLAVDASGRVDLQPADYQVIAKAIFAGGNVYYLRSDGNDSNDGKSPVTAFLTWNHVLGVLAAKDTVIVGPGTFTSTSSNIPANVTIIGCGRETTTINQTGLGGGGFSPGNNCLFRDLTINGSSGDAITATSSTVTGIQIRNCRLVAGGTGVCVALASASTARLENCELNGSAFEGVSVAGTAELDIFGCVWTGSFANGDVVVSGGACRILGGVIQTSDNPSLSRSGGTLQVCGLAYDPTTTSGTITVLPVPDAWQYATRSLTDKAGFALSSGEHTAIAGDTQSGLTAQGYTGTRAGYLDTLNGLVAAIWSNTTRTLTAIADSAGVTTLLSRITGSIAPQTGDSYARLGTPHGASIAADIAAVTAPTVAQIDAQLSGTHGAGAWGGAGGTGAFAVTVTVTDGSSNPLNGAIVSMARQGGGTFRATTNSSGVASFSLDAGTYTLAATFPGYSYTPTTQIVSAAGNINAAMALIVIPAPSGPQQTTGYLTTYDGSGAVAGGVVISFRAVGTTLVGASIPTSPILATSNNSGLLTVELAQSTTYAARRGVGGWVEFTTGTGASYELPAVLGAP